VSESNHETYLQMTVMRILLFPLMIFIFLVVNLIFSAGVPLTRQTEETRVWQKKIRTMGQRPFTSIQHDKQPKQLKTRLNYYTNSLMG